MIVVPERANSEGTTYIRGIFKELCKMDARGHKNSLRSGSKLLEAELLRSPLNVCTVKVTSDLSMGLY